MNKKEEKKHTSLKEFYPYHLTEHNNPKNRALHFIGTGLVIFILVYGVATFQSVEIALAYSNSWLWFCLGGPFFYRKKQTRHFYLSGLQPGF